MTITENLAVENSHWNNNNETDDENDERYNGIENTAGNEMKSVLIQGFQGKLRIDMPFHTFPYIQLDASSARSNTNRQSIAVLEYFPSQTFTAKANHSLIHLPNFSIIPREMSIDIHTPLASLPRIIGEFHQENVTGVVTGFANATLSSNNSVSVFAKFDTLSSRKSGNVTVITVKDGTETEKQMLSFAVNQNGVRLEAEMSGDVGNVTTHASLELNRDCTSRNSSLTFPEHNFQNTTTFFSDVFTRVENNLGCLQLMKLNVSAQNVRNVSEKGTGEKRTILQALYNGNSSSTIIQFNLTVDDSKIIFKTEKNEEESTASSQLRLLNVTNVFGATSLSHILNIIKSVSSQNSSPTLHDLDLTFGYHEGYQTLEIGALIALDNKTVLGIKHADTMSDTGIRNFTSSLYTNIERLGKGDIRCGILLISNNTSWSVRSADFCAELQRTYNQAVTVPHSLGNNNAETLYPSSETEERKETSASSRSKRSVGLFLEPHTLQNATMGIDLNGLTETPTNADQTMSVSVKYDGLTNDLKTLFFADRHGEQLITSAAEFRYKSPMDMKCFILLSSPWKAVPGVVIDIENAYNDNVSSSNAFASSAASFSWAPDRKFSYSADLRHRRIPGLENPLDFQSEFVVFAQLGENKTREVTVRFGEVDLQQNASFSVKVDEMTLADLDLTLNGSVLPGMRHVPLLLPWNISHPNPGFIESISHNTTEFYKVDMYVCWNLKFKDSISVNTAVKKNYGQVVDIDVTVKLTRPQQRSYQVEYKTHNPSRMHHYHNQSSRNKFSRSASAEITSHGSSPMKVFYTYSLEVKDGNASRKELEGHFKVGSTLRAVEGRGTWVTDFKATTPSKIWTRQALDGVFNWDADGDGSKLISMATELRRSDVMKSFDVKLAVPVMNKVMNNLFSFIAKISLLLMFFFCLFKIKLR
jgi:hypothetical protein